MNDLFFSVFPSENFVDLGLFQFGQEKCEPAHSFGPAARNHFLFHYVISGNGVLYADDSQGNTRTYELEGGQGFMIFPGQINTYIADRVRPWEYVWIEFDGLRVKGMLEMAGFTPNSPVYRARQPELRENMKSEMEYIAHNAGLSPFHLIGHTYLFLDYLVRSAADLHLNSGGKLRDFYVHEALNYIEHNFQNDISVEGIAAVCGLNRSYFGKIFKETIGKSPQDFLMSFRMAKAAEMLKLTSRTVGDIGACVGYPNPLHFSRAFKTVYGLPPREWRNRNKITLKESRN